MTELPRGWKRTKMGEIGQYLNGKAFKSQDWKSSGRPIIRIQNLTGSGTEFNYFNGEIEDRYVVQPGDLLFSWSATLGTYIWKGPEAVLNQHIFKVESNIDKRFHRYLLDFKIQEMHSRTHGSGMVHITKKSFDAIEVNIPPIDEQHKVVELLEDHLSRLDAALGDLKQAKIKAAQFRMTVLHSIFNSSTNTEDWKSTSLEKIGVWKTGSTPLSKNPEFQGSDVKFVTPGDIGYGGKLNLVARTISSKGADSVRRISPPSVHLVGIGTSGKVAWTHEIVTTNQQINSLEVDTSENNPEFLMWLLASPGIQEKLWSSSSSTTVPILNKGNLEKIQCSLPSLETQNEIMKLIDSSFSKLEAVLETANRLENQSSVLRRSLLQAAFTGQLTKEVVIV